MKVNSNRTEVKKGIFGKTVHRFEYKIDLSDEERHQLKKLGIEKDVLYAIRPFDDDYECYTPIKRAVEQGDSFEHKELSRVMEHEQMVMGKLKELAEYIRGTAGDAPNKSVEF